MKLNHIVVIAGGSVVIGAISWWTGQISYTWFPPQASLEALEIDDLFSFLTAVGTFIFLGVFSAIIYAVIFQRAGRYDFSDGPPIEGNIPLEIVWTAVPFALVIWIAANSYRIYDEMKVLGPMEHIHAEAVTATGDDTIKGIEKEGPIEVLARQWEWEFRYPEVNVSSSELHLPSNKRVKLVLKSEDVLHGFYVPAFRLKQDLIPDRIINFEFTPTKEGRYRLRDSQYSGTYFAAMQTDVVVESPEAYQNWLNEVKNRPKQPAYNPAFEEFTKLNSKALGKGWKTIVPAKPSLVNYTNSPNSPEKT